MLGAVWAMPMKLRRCSRVPSSLQRRMRPTPCDPFVRNRDAIEKSYTKTKREGSGPLFMMRVHALGDENLILRFALPPPLPRPEMEWPRC